MRERENERVNERESIRDSWGEGRIEILYIGV